MNQVCYASGMTTNKEPRNVADFASVEEGAYAWRVLVWSIDGDESVLVDNLANRSQAEEMVDKINTALATWEDWA